MIQVWLVDGNTRLHLPESQWGQAVVEKLQQQNHQVVNQGPQVGDDDRSQLELARRDILLHKTGL